MKSKIISLQILITLFICAMSPFVSSGSEKIKKTGIDSLVCLEISGKIAGKEKETVVIRLFDNNKQVDSVITSTGKIFSFTLLRNSFYTVKIFQEGYIERSVSIDTELPKSISNSALFRFQFDTKLAKKEQAARHEMEISDFPIALIKYQTEKGWFDYSRKYTNLIKKGLAVDSSN